MKRGDRVLVIQIKGFWGCPVMVDAEFLMNRNKYYIINTKEYGKTTFNKNRTVLLDQKEYGYVGEELKKLYSEYKLKQDAWTRDQNKAIRKFTEEWEALYPSPKFLDLDNNFLSIIHNLIEQSDSSIK